MVLLCEKNKQLISCIQIYVTCTENHFTRIPNHVSLVIVKTSTFCNSAGFHSQKLEKDHSISLKPSSFPLLNPSQTSSIIPSSVTTSFPSLKCAVTKMGLGDHNWSIDCFSMYDETCHVFLHA